MSLLAHPGQLSSLNQQAKVWEINVPTVDQSYYAAKYQVPSMTDPNKEPYVVSLTQKGDWQCSCPRWTKSKLYRRQDCKHIFLAQDFRNKQAVIVPTRPTRPRPRPRPAAKPVAKPKPSPEVDEKPTSNIEDVGDRFAEFFNMGNKK